MSHNSLPPSQKEGEETDSPPSRDGGIRGSRVEEEAGSVGGDDAALGPTTLGFEDGSAAAVGQSNPRPAVSSESEQLPSGSVTTRNDPVEPSSTADSVIVSKCGKESSSTTANFVESKVSKKIRTKKRDETTTTNNPVKLAVTRRVLDDTKVDSKVAPSSSAMEALVSKTGAVTRDRGPHSRQSSDSFSILSESSEQPGAIHVHPEGTTASVDGMDNIVDPPYGYTETMDGHDSSNGGGPGEITLQPPPHVDAEVVNDEDRITHRLKQLQKEAILPSTVIAESTTSTSSSSCSRWCPACLVIGTFIIVGTVTTLILNQFFLPTEDDAETRSPLPSIEMTANPSGQPSMSPTMTDLEYLQWLFQPISGDQVYNETSSRFQAIQYLLRDDGFLKANTIQNLERYTLMDRYVLAVLYFSSTGAPWTRMFINAYSQNSLCELGWCNDQGRVSTIWLGGAELEGTLPPELSAWTALETLILYSNRFHGTIPEELYELTKLRTLELAGNLLSGTISNSIANLRRLRRLIINSNELTGSIPEGILKMESLRGINLGSNHLTGTLPEFATDHVACDDEDCGDVALSTRLRSIYLSYNHFSGSIPQSIYQLTDLEELYLTGNLLTGTISPSIGASKKLQRISLSRNTLTGNIPSTIGLMTNLREFGASRNQLEGSIPSEIGNLLRLQYVYLSSCKLRGELPSKLGAMSSLKYLNIAYNENITGGFPTFFSTMPSLEMLQIQGTQMTSTESVVTFCNSTALQTQLVTSCGEHGGFECPCCSSCCGDGCSHNAPQSCEIYTERLSHQDGNYYEEPRGTTCNCGEDGRSLLCSDSGCESCTKDRSVCALSKDYGYILTEGGYKDGWHVTFEYVKGLNDTVTFEDRYGSGCKVTVNGIPCFWCSRLLCTDGHRGYGALCFQGATTACASPEWPPPFDQQGVGPLAVLDMLDSTHRADECIPRIWPEQIDEDRLSS